MRSLIVAVNKLDLSGAEAAERFREVESTLSSWIRKTLGGFKKTVFVPVSGTEGINVVKRGFQPWYEGPSLVEAINALEETKRPAAKPLRMVVADVYRKAALSTHVVAGGKIEAGHVSVGDVVCAAPGGKLLKVKTVVGHGGDAGAAYALAGENVELGLLPLDKSQDVEPGHLKVGDLLCDPHELASVPLECSAKITALWSTEAPLLAGTHLRFHTQSSQVGCVLQKIVCVHNADGRRVRKRAVRPRGDGGGGFVISGARSARDFQRLSTFGKVSSPETWERRWRRESWRRFRRRRRSTGKPSAGENAW